MKSPDFGSDSAWVKKSGISNFLAPCSLLVHEIAYEWLEH